MTSGYLYLLKEERRDGSKKNLLWSSSSIAAVDKGVFAERKGAKI